MVENYETAFALMERLMVALAARRREWLAHSRLDSSDELRGTALAAHERRRGVSFHFGGKEKGKLPHA